MEYNFLADFLNKFSQFTPWIQDMIIILLPVIPISILYFSSQILVKFIELKVSSQALLEKAKLSSLITENLINDQMTLRNKERSL